MPTMKSTSSCAIFTVFLVALCLPGCDPGDEFEDANTDDTGLFDEDTEEVADMEDPGESEEAEEYVREIQTIIDGSPQAQQSRQTCIPGGISSAKTITDGSGGTSAPAPQCPRPAPKP